MPFSFNAFRQYLPLIASFLLVLICLSPILESGLLSDDLINFQTNNGIKQEQKRSSMEHAKDEIEKWKHSGRYYPLSNIIGACVFKNFQTITGYKVFIFIVNVCAVVSFALLLHTLGLPALIPFFLFFYAGLIQMRVQFYDSFTSFNGSYPILAIFIFICMALYKLYLEKGKIPILIFSIISFISALLMSEIGLILVPLLALITVAHHPGRRKWLLPLLPFLFLCVVYAGYVMYLRLSTNQLYNGIEIRPDSGKIITALGIQLFSAVPFSNLFHQANIPGILEQQTCSWLAIAALVTLPLAALALIFNPPLPASFRIPGSASVFIIILSIILIAIPACFIALSSKYQDQLKPGLGYLPVYIQNFGSALIISYISFLTWHYHKTGLRVIYTFLIITGFISAGSAFLFNKALIKAKNYTYCFPARSLYESVKRGILSPCPDNSTIYLTRDYFWFDQGYEEIFNSCTGKSLAVKRYDDRKAEAADEAGDHCFILDCQPGDTIFSRLFALDCCTGYRTLLKCDTTLHQIRLSPVELHILNPPG